MQKELNELAAKIATELAVIKAKHNVGVLEIRAVAAADGVSVTTEYDAKLSFNFENSELMDRASAIKRQVVNKAQGIHDAFAEEHR